MAVCEACGTLDAQAFEFDGITFELCRHHAHVWMARCMKEDREEASQKTRIGKTPEPYRWPDGYVARSEATRDMGVRRDDVFERRATIENGWEFWYLRWVTAEVEPPSMRRQLGSLHKTSKTAQTTKKTFERYVNGARTFVVRQIRHGMVVSAQLYENGSATEMVG